MLFLSHVLSAASALMLGTGVAYASVPVEAIMFKNPNCTCCAGYAEHLEDNGIKVKVVPTDQMAKVKQQARIPVSETACHTLSIGGYAVEGHVPFKAIEKLFEEMPDVNGLTLAGMPSGSPGMPGPKMGDFEVKSFKNGQAELYGKF
ncbi:DUF411 domain-containing protein [Halomonas sp. LBP4]|uniref:DUF411 domain-containing protein n=1 Tax=Halomonas sp. LBP4 TaxID=2044917 RepID=UPI000D75F156|nr:DUF411 domain-containing protein [Halomonas sp. LBP4]PXX94645.1 hypothetical protein CR157_21750 [Halomonas sp. LBP4]